MKIAQLPSRLVAVLLFAGLPASQAGAAPFASEPANGQLVIHVAEDCYSIGQQVAAQNGGTLARASATTRSGQAVCEIVVLVPGRDGERPRRTVVVVPRG
jgi:hypothetical protein